MIKKKIFRKLFNTEMYEQIVNELGNRKRNMEREIAVIRPDVRVRQQELNFLEIKQRKKIPETTRSVSVKNGWRN